MKWSLEDLALVVGGTAVGTGEFDRVVIDSREAGPGALFVALQGEHHDGHEFAGEAAAAGGLVLTGTGRMPEGSRGVEAADPLDALRAMAERRRSELTVPVAAITGSNGKTTTKDLLAAAVGSGAHKSPRSFNNEIGVPLTILGAPGDATAVIAEVGSRGPGHIAHLASCLQPDVAVITNIARAHLETFGDEAAIVDAKWELIESLRGDGIAVLPAGDERLTGRNSGPMVTFGDEPGADVAVSDVVIGADGRATCSLTHAGRTLRPAIALAGRHQPLNLAAAVAAALALGVDFDTATERAAAASGSAWRMEVHRGRYTVVNDAYNANPDSTASALATVAAMPGRHVAVLGKMHELGESEAAGHREVGERARRLGFAAVVVVGDDPGIAAGAGPIARRVADIEEAAVVLDGYLTDGDVVLVKASRAEGLETLAVQLKGAAS